MSDSLDYAKLTTPPGDGDVLIEPPAREWPALLEHNLKRHAGQSLKLAGHDLHEAREATRGAMISRDRRDGILACGHQPAFAHAGVWAKHVAVRHMASRLGLKGLDLAVDNDAPVRAGLVVPVLRDGLVEMENVTFSAAPAGCAYEGRPALTRERLREIRQELQVLLDARFGESLLPDYLRGYEESSLDIDFVDQHIVGRALIDAPLEAYLCEYRVSSFFGGAFLPDLLLNAADFAGAYNRALGHYRRREGVRSPDRPLPDLGRDGARTEAALWIYKPLERRKRLWVERAANRLRLFADAQSVGELGADDLARDANAALATLRPWVIRPRALTLTFWARLLVCDLFVHGIGGAKYDRITDDIFRGYYHCEPPALACVSATLRLPLPQHPVTLNNLREAQRSVRDLAFNPHRYLSAAPAELLRERENWIEASRRLREGRGDRMERRRVFLALHEVNERLRSLEPQLAIKLTQQAQQMRAALESNRIAGSREFFYALQPRDRLAMLAGRVLEACRLD